MFDWLAFLDEHGVEYVTAGPNVARGNVNVHCPFCGSADQSHHMGINLHGRGWGCWRDGDHRGKKPERLITALIGCSYEHARRIVGAEDSAPEHLLSQVKNLLDPEEVSVQEDLSLPTEFRTLYNLKFKNNARPFIDYLRNRGFTDGRHLSGTLKKCNIHYATRGPFKGRIIFPVMYDKKLITWTGRTIYPSEKIRYKTLTLKTKKSFDEGTPLALGPITNYLLWYDYLLRSQSNVLLIVEGPMDALKVRYLGSHYGIEATCLFTASVSNDQLNLLCNLLPRFKRKLLLLDANATKQSLTILSGLAGLGIELGRLPKGVGDPGDLKNVNDLWKIIS